MAEPRDLQHSTLGEVYRAVSETVEALTPRDFLRGTRCEAWTVQDLLFHLLLDAQRALAALALTTDEPADVDALTYWAPFRPGTGDGGAASARFTRIGSSAYSSPRSLAEHWTETAGAVIAALAAAGTDQRVRTQGHVLTTADLTSTLVVEAAVHHLDLTLHVAGPPTPPRALELCRAVFDGILGERLPVAWSDEEYALKATGRTPLTEADLRGLGDRTARFPLLG